MKYILLASLLILIGCKAGTDRSEIYQPNGVAIHGYDPVAFFTENRPVKGSSEYVYNWKDAQWQFASQAHLDSFKVNPTKYAPQYGGFCAYGTAEGHKAPTEIETWTIRDGRLFFNYNMDVKSMWNKDIEGYIKQGDDNWPKIKNDKF